MDSLYLLNLEDSISNGHNYTPYFTVQGHVLGAHSTVQRCLLLLQLLECLSSLRNSNIYADTIRHCEPSHGRRQGGWAMGGMMLDLVLNTAVASVRRRGGVWRVARHG